MTAKSVLVRSQGLRPRARTPTCYATTYNSNLANFMVSNFMTHKLNGIAQLF